MLKKHSSCLEEPGVLLFWLLAAALLSMLLGAHPTLKIILNSPGGHIRLVEPHGLNKQVEPLAQQVLPGIRAISVPLPKTLKRQLVLELSNFSAEPSFSRAELQLLGFKKSIRLASNMQPKDQSHNTNLITIDLPSAFNWSCAIIWTISAGFAAFLIKLWPRRIENHDLLTNLAIAWVILSYLAFAYQVTWTSVRLPEMDDWRYYSEGTYSLINRQFHWVTVSGNDTYFLTGQTIDWILLNLFNGNFLPVRLFGLLALAAFLAFAIGLILKFGKSFAAVCLIFLSLSISSSSYWGNTGIAYHQMLPVLFFVWSLWQLTQITADSAPKPSQITLFVALPLAAGLAYISGPLLFIGLAAASITILLVQRLSEKTRSGLPFWQSLDQWRAPILILSTTGLVTMLLQLSIVVSRQGSLLEHSHASATILPTEARFWWFLGGIVGRAIGLRSSNVTLDFMVLGLFGLSLLYLIIFAATRKPKPHESQMLLIALCCGLGMLLYAGAVSAGRSGLAGPDPVSSIQISNYAKARFHYWWLAALLPIYASILLELIKPNRSSSRLIVGSLIAPLILLKISQTLSEDIPTFDAARQREHRNVDCLRSNWVEFRTNKEHQFICPELYPGPLNHFVRAMLVRSLQPAREIFQYQNKRGKK